MGEDDLTYKLMAYAIEKNHKDFKVEVLGAPYSTPRIIINGKVFDLAEKEIHDFVSPDEKDYLMSRIVGQYEDLGLNQEGNNISFCTSEVVELAKGKNLIDQIIEAEALYEKSLSALREKREKEKTKEYDQIIKESKTS